MNSSLSIGPVSLSCYRWLGAARLRCGFYVRPQIYMACDKCDKTAIRAHTHTRTLAYIVQGICQYIVLCMCMHVHERACICMPYVDYLVWPIIARGKKNSWGHTYDKGQQTRIQNQKTQKWQKNKNKMAMLLADDWPRACCLISQRRYQRQRAKLIR